VNCAEARDLTHLYIDQELDLVRVADVDRHLQSCPACHALYERQRALSASLKGEANYHRAPPELREHLGAALSAETGDATRPRSRRFNRWNTGISVAAVVVLSVSVSLFMLTPTAQDRLEDEIVSSHVRSLMVNHLSDVASSDHHTVKPWFNGKLDYSPPVRDLTSQGFPLMGGRLDYLEDRPVAALVYRHRLHLINLFIWPSKSEQAQGVVVHSHQGYNLLHWARGGMGFWAVSDLNKADLKQFAEEFSAGAASPPS
jgi:anti-sigma factor RsiW